MPLKNHKFIFLFLLAAVYGGAQVNIDSLAKAAARAGNDTAKLRILSTLSENASDGVWQEYNRQMGRLASTLLGHANEQVRRKARFYYAGYLSNVGFQEENKGRSDTALAYYFKSLEIRKSLNDEPGISNCYNNIGLAYHHKGDLKKAIDYYHRALKIQDKIGDKLGMGYSLSNIGYLLYNQGEHDKAIDYFKKSLVVRNDIGDLGGLAFSLLNLGHTYKEKGMLDSAEAYFNQSLSIREKIGDKIGIAYSLINLAGVHQARNDHQKALALYTRGQKLQEETGDLAGLASSYFNIATVYYQLKDYNRAIELGKKVLDIGRKLGYPGDIKNGALILKNAYQKSGRPKEALEMLELFIVMRDSLANEDLRKQNLKKQMEFEYEKKEAEVKARSEAEKEKIQLVAAEEKRRQNTIILAVSIVLILVIALAFIIFRSLQENKKMNRIISEQKDMVEQKQKEILDSIRYAKRIQQSLMPNEKYISRVMRSRTNDA